MHTDNPYRYPTPDYQLLHAIEQCSCAPVAWAVPRVVRTSNSHRAARGATGLRVRALGPSPRDPLRCCAPVPHMVLWDQRCTEGKVHGVAGHHVRCPAAHGEGPVARRLFGVEVGEIAPAPHMAWCIGISSVHRGGGIVKEGERCGNAH